MGEGHHRYIRYDGNGNYSGGRQASISEIHLGSDVLKRISDVLKRICSQKKYIDADLLDDLCVDRLTRLRHEHHFLAELTTLERLREQVVGHRNLVDRVPVNPVDPVRSQLRLPTVHRLCKKTTNVKFQHFKKTKSTDVSPMNFQNSRMILFWHISRFFSSNSPWLEKVKPRHVIGEKKNKWHFFRDVQSFPARGLGAL